MKQYLINPKIVENLSVATLTHTQVRLRYAFGSLAKYFQIQPEETSCKMSTKWPSAMVRQMSYLWKYTNWQICSDRWYAEVYTLVVNLSAKAPMYYDENQSCFVALMTIVISSILLASISQCGSSGIPVYLWLHWSSSVICPAAPSVLTESGLEVIKSGHFPACDPLCIQLVWWELFELNRFHLTCNPKYTNTIMTLISKACTE